MAAGRLDTRGVIVTCPSCGQNNRLPFAALNKSIRCASCKTMLSAPGSPIEATESAAFRAAWNDSALPIIVDFWAPWCKPCDAIEPHLLGLADAWGDRVRLVRVNVDEEAGLSARYGVLSLPTVILFAEGDRPRRSAPRPLPARVRAIRLTTRARYERSPLHECVAMPGVAALASSALGSRRGLASPSQGAGPAAGGRFGGEPRGRRRPHGGLEDA